MKFVFFILHQLDSCIPSYRMVKQMCLPGMTLPTRVSIHIYGLTAGFLPSSSLFLPLPLCMRSLFLGLTIFQHQTATGVPFYVNSIEAILKKCLANRDIASLIARYPIIPRDEMRYHYYNYSFPMPQSTSTLNNTNPHTGIYIAGGLCYSCTMAF